MISGFVPRNVNQLSVSNRTSLPLWAARAQNRSATLSANQFGPAVSATRPLGRYLEDNEYLGDLGYIQGVQFDLDEFNGRLCITPEFPGGTYAYFTAISSNGTPVFPYNIGRQFYGSPTGGSLMSGAYPESVTTNFVGGAKSPYRLEPPVLTNGARDVTLSWSSVEGGAYVVSATTNFRAWTTNGFPTITATGAVGRITESGAGTVYGTRFYKVTRTAVAPSAN